MPTDGADFGRTRPCYGKAYTMARDGADNSDVAECVMRGVELDIKRDGGAPAFPVAVDILLLACSSGGNHQQLKAGVETIRRNFVDSPLTRHFAEAVAKIGLAAIAEGRGLTREQAERMLLVQIAESRCCDGMAGYVARKRTNNVAASLAIVESIKSELGHTVAVRDLASRMRNCSSKGMPAKAAKAAPVKHSAESLNNEEL